MAFRRKKVKDNFSLDMTTCSDIIFTLLLFYILTQNFMPQTTLELPETQSEEQADALEQVKVEIDADGKLLWNDEDYSEEKLLEEIIKTSSNQDNISIIIFAHKKSPAGICIQLLDKLRNAGIKNVIFAGAPIKSKRE